MKIVISGRDTERRLSDANSIADRFEEHRAHMRAVAFRILGSTSDAEDAVQDAWLRITRSDTETIDNLGGWLTSVVSRIALDKVRSRTRNKEIPTGAHPPDTNPTDRHSPEDETVVADAVGMAMLIVLERLQPAERVAFVLHDTFAVPFADIGEVLDRSPNAAKQLASRARRKVRGSEPVQRDPIQERKIVDAFLNAANHGDLAGLLDVLDPEVVLQADPAAVGMGSPAQLHGSRDVAAMFNGRAQGAQALQIDGAPGVAWIVADKTKVAWDMTIIGGRITHIDMLADPEHLAELDLEWT